MPPCSLPVHVEDQLFYPQSRMKWPGFIFTPSFDPRSHFSRRYTLANATLATFHRLSPPQDVPSTLPLSLLGAFAPCSNSLIWVCCLEPSPSLMSPMAVFWHRVCRCITHCFSTINRTCLHREASLPRLPALIRYEHRLAGLRLICSPPEITPPTERPPKSIRTFWPPRAPLLAGGKITSQPYLFFNLDWRSAPAKAKNPRYCNGGTL